MEANNEIINRIADSALKVFDLEDYYPEGQRVGVDLSQWLVEGFILREKDFRHLLKQHDWSVYKDAYVAVYCSTDAIVPAWASILITMHLAPFAKEICSGNLADIDVALYTALLPQLDYAAFQDQAVIIKGCAKKPVPMQAYVLAAQYLQPFAKSIMYGEACSAVPLFKKSKGN